MQREGNLAEMIRQLEADRRRHAAAIEAIDRVLDQVSRVVGIARPELADFPVPLGIEMPPHPEHAIHLDARRRGKFEQTGERSVLQFIYLRGNPTTAEINAHWRSEGRRGVANVMLLKLLKQGLIHRQLDPQVRGSRYAVTSRGEAEHRNFAAAGGDGGGGEFGPGEEPGDTGEAAGPRLHIGPAHG